MDLMMLRRGLLAQMAGGLLKKVGTHTLQEAFSSGNGTDLVPIIMDDSMLSSDAITYVLVFNGNTFNSSYKVDCIVFGTQATTVSGLSTIIGYCFRNGYENLANGVGVTVRASAGTQIDVYRMDH